jgi:hypothetical protein
VRLLDASDYSPWFTFIGFTGEEWLTLLPQNYYYGSANGDRYLSARVGNTVSGADRYRQNLKSAALALGMRASMDLAVRFLEPNNRAAISREARLQLIVSSSVGTAAQVSRAEIEAYYRQNIGKLIASEVDAQFKEKSIPLNTVTYIKQSLTNFFLTPNQTTFNVIKKIYQNLDNLETEQWNTNQAINIVEYGQEQGWNSAEFKQQATTARARQTALNTRRKELQATNDDNITWADTDRAYSNVLYALSSDLSKKVRE